MLTTLNENTRLDLDSVRAQFPALAQTVNGRTAIFLDGPGGTQVPQRVIDAISQYLSRDNANSGGNYETSRRTDRMLVEARSAMADFLNCDADEVAFGMNMTSLTFAMSRAIGREPTGFANYSLRGTRGLQPAEGRKQKISARGGDHRSCHQQC